MQQKAKIPGRIGEILEKKNFSVNRVGMSGAQVLCLEDLVLKIEPTGPEADNEARMLRWLCGRLPVPEMVAFERQGGCNYLLMSRVEGDMLCQEKFVQDPPQLSSLLAQGLLLLWGTDTEGCPCDQSLANKLRRAAERVENGLCSTEDAEEGTYGKGGFASPAQLLAWLQSNRPEEELVLSHGDYCLPNVFARQDRITGLIDLGRCGVADRYQDIALGVRSLEANCRGRYAGSTRTQPDVDAFFGRLGFSPDWEKIRYYILLDELF